MIKVLKEVSKAQGRLAQQSEGARRLVESDDMSVTDKMNAMAGFELKFCLRLKT